MSTAMVMASVSASVVLTYAFMQTQVVSNTISQNASLRGLVAQAAQTGAAAALQDIQSPTWGGVSVPLSGTLLSDSSGTLSYDVTYQPYQAATGETLDADDALKVIIQSIGRWQPAATSSGNTETQSTTPQPVTRTVEVTVQLMPRLPGRTIGPGDTASAEDVAINPNDYDSIQNYAVFAKSSGDFDVDPGVRIEGNLYLKQSLSLFSNPGWSGSIEDRVLKDLKQRFVTTSGGATTFQHPYPLAGSVSLYSNPTEGHKNDYSDAAVVWNRNTTVPSYPSITYSNFQQYRLFDDGFVYTAQTVNSTLSNTTLRPSATNPLGIFYRNGSITLYSDVTIQGTLVSTGTINIIGDRVQVTSFNWKGTGGTALVSNADLWPRLPALVAEDVFIERNTSVIIEGAIAAADSFSGTGGQLEYNTGLNEVSLAGTATASPLQQPWSEVRLDNSVNLSGVSGNGNYAVWLARGTSGNWYPITSVNANERKLTVLGEVRADAAVNYSIRRAKKQYVEVRGPISGSDHDIYHCTDWDLSSITWNILYSRWQDAVDDTPNNQTPPLFTEWLATPANFSAWPSPYREVGLSLEPTFTARSTTNIKYRWSPPLFEAYQSNDPSATPYTGYRWKVLSWRELN